MAKKSHTGHRPAPQQAKGAARKPQAPAGATSSATLVRPPSATDSAPISSASAPATPSASNVVADTPVATPSAAKSAAKSAAQSASSSASSSGAARPVSPKPAPAAAPARRAAVAERPAAPKPAAPKPAAPAPRPQATAISTREQNQRLARARATQRARQANLISAESYSYVLGDLKLIIALAVSALIVLVALTFVLPH